MNNTDILTIKTSAILGFILLIFGMSILPLGLGSTEIMLSSCIFLAITFIFITIPKDHILYLSVIIFFPLFQILTNLIIEKSIDFFQIARVNAPLFIGIFVYYASRRLHSFQIFFYKNESKLAVFLLSLILLYYLTDIRLFSVSLDTFTTLSESDSLRIYLYSPCLFFLLFLLALKDMKKIVFIYLFFLVITLSKSVFLSIFISFALYLFSIIFTNNSKDNKPVSKIIITALIISFAAVIPIILDRFITFFAVGDLWRLTEIISVIELIRNEPSILLIGYGVGIPYRDFMWSLYNGDNYPLINNMRYDLHNLYLDVIVKYGAIYLLIYLIYFYKLISKFNMVLKLQILFMFIIYGFTSPALFHSIDFIAFMLGLSIIDYRHNHQFFKKKI